MPFESDLSHCQEYLSFRSCMPLRKIIVDNNVSKVWKLYDTGPRSVRCPLMCIPPVCGTADIFFKQCLALHAKGIRVIAVEHPVYWSVAEWCEGLHKLLDYLQLDKVHLFGASIGGYLAQKFTERTSHCPRVASLVLCNSFTDTSIFSFQDIASLFWMLPSLILKKMVMGNLSQSKMDPEIADSVDFIVERLDSLTQQELASRLTINCTSSYVQPQKLHNFHITVLDVFDECALSVQVRDNMYKCYPDAKLAHLKSGGNFPYLSRSDEVNMHLQIHLRVFEGTSLSASEPPPNIASTSASCSYTEHATEVHIMSASSSSVEGGAHVR